MRLVEPDTTCLEQRADAVESIESHITDLQSVFGKLASLISDQRSDAMRIDENVGSALDSVEAGQGELITTQTKLCHYFHHVCVVAAPPREVYCW